MLLPAIAAVTTAPIAVVACCPCTRPVQPWTRAGACVHTWCGGACSRRPPDYGLNDLAPFRDAETALFWRQILDACHDRPAHAERIANTGETVARDERARRSRTIAPAVMARFVTASTSGSSFQANSRRYLRRAVVSNGTAATRGLTAVRRFRSPAPRVLVDSCVALDNSDLATSSSAHCGDEAAANREGLRTVMYVPASYP